MNDAHGWFQTYTGLKFYPLNPDESMIRLEDIVHALAGRYRFSCHAKKRISVAEHSLLVADLVYHKTRDHRQVLRALLHDASEAYYADIPRPLKIMPEMQPYRDAEKRLQDLIYRIYGVENVPDDVVKWADTVALGIEAQATMAPLTEPQEWIWCCMQAQGFIAMRWKLAEMDCFMAEAAFSKALLRAIAGQYIPEGYFKWPV